MASMRRTDCTTGWLVVSETAGACEAGAGLDSEGPDAPLRLGVMGIPTAEMLDRVPFATLPVASTGVAGFARLGEVATKLDAVVVTAKDEFGAAAAGCSRVETGAVTTAELLPASLREGETTGL